ncbi:MAG: hypothetical protein KDJ47_03590 [Hyphomicrobiaceae bacterium]|nr:hypothetical protein [Hyphomicrobiaceae bacterium]
MLPRLTMFLDAPHYWRTATLTFAIAGLGLLASSPVAAQAPDPHAIYESRCSACHQPHASDLAKSSLTMRDGMVVLKSSDAPFELFLAKHPRGLSQADRDVLLKQFKGMLETGYLYQDKCIACHDRASTLARLRLFERDGVIEGRYTYRDISTFLRDHGRLTPMEVDTIMKMFHRQLQPGEAQ